MASNEARIKANFLNDETSSRNLTWDKDATGTRNAYISEIFAKNVFTLKELQKALPKNVYARFIHQLKGRQSLDRPTADAVAHAARVWAMDRGATHFTHLFQPQTGTTAEKHDNFLSLKTVMSDGGIEETTPLDTFSGSQLLQSEPDASSFPNGGMRTTFEARGYTIWDTTSPMFLRTAPHGTKVLYIPSVFISYNGEALDEKTILLRSCESLSNAAVALLSLLGDKDTKRVSTTLGTEQEFFLIDRNQHNIRPDLKVTGRTLIGMPPPKHQQLDDHYFGQIPARHLAAIAETELELWRLGVPVKTRHNEVAPAQFEMAPIFEDAPVAVDHNLLTMDVLNEVALRHNLKALFHEKPFAGINGSGKHCNWSMQTDSGDNLLEPTLKPETNYRFLLFLTATLDALNKHGGLLRAGIASASNEHRLGANEAPPGIISAFLGDHLTEVLNSVEDNRGVKTFSQPHLQTVKVGGTVLDLKVATLPNISRDLTDRNRTSPFAFTGNKFEFRAVGSKQSPSFPVTLLNTAVAASLTEMTNALLKQMQVGKKTEPGVEDVLIVVREYIAKSKPVRFEGNNYSDEWKAEAAVRGLPNIKDCPTAFRQLMEPHNKELLVRNRLFTESELNSRFHILMEKYAKDLLIEATTLKTMVIQGVLPAAFEYRKSLADAVVSLNSAGCTDIPELAVLNALGKLVGEATKAVEELGTFINEVEGLEGEEQADAASSKLGPAMVKVRKAADEIEEKCADKSWPYPKYTELLF